MNHTDTNAAIDRFLTVLARQDIVADDEAALRFHYTRRGMGFVAACGQMIESTAAAFDLFAQKFQAHGATIHNDELRAQDSEARFPFNEKYGVGFHYVGQRATQEARYADNFAVRFARRGELDIDAWFALYQERDAIGDWWVRLTDAANVRRQLAALRPGDRVHATQPRRGPQVWCLNGTPAQHPASLYAAARHAADVGRAREEGQSIRIR
jgi:hypothetical protein